MSLPTRTLASHPDLAQLKRQAKELLKDFAAGNPAAVAEITGHYRGADAKSFALSDAQLVLARAYGFRSWPALKAFVDGVTVRRLVEAVCAGDAATVRAMAARRPEIVNLDVAENDEHQALHYAVLTRQPDLVRLLMQLGAEPRKGIYPHRQATTAVALATERGYDELVAIILEEERTRPRPPMVAVLGDDVPALNAAVEQNDEPAIISALDAHPGLVNASDPTGRTALHWAAERAWERVTAWLLDHGAAVNARAKNGETPLDLVARDVEPSSSRDRSSLSTRLAELLLGRGATPTVKWAAASGVLAGAPGEFPTGAQPFPSGHDGPLERHAPSSDCGGTRPLVGRRTAHARHDGARRRRASRCARHGAAQHTARVGVPMGSDRTGQALPESRSRSHRSRRRTVGATASMGEEDEPARRD
jgi:ankyrin repeat protein